MNICQCGTQAGYPHPYGCPYPYYGNAAHLVAGWQSAAADVAQATEDAHQAIDPCAECGLSTAFGSGRFVNRIPADDGYLCAECAAIECDACGEPIPLDEDVTAERLDPIGAVYCYKFHAECVPADVVVIDEVDA